MRTLMMQVAMAIVIVSGLVACGGGTGEVHDSGRTVLIDTYKVKTTVDKPVAYDIEISGMSNDVLVGSKNTVLRMKISGSNNEIVISLGSSVDTLEMTGVNNNVYVPVGFRFGRQTNIGSGNSVIER